MLQESNMNAAMKERVGNAGVGIFAMAILLAGVAVLGAIGAPLTFRDSPALPQTPGAGGLDRDKATAFGALERDADAMKALGAELWRTPELSFREFETSRALIRYLESNGFT